MADVSTASPSTETLALGDRQGPWGPPAGSRPWKERKTDHTHAGICVCGHRHLGQPGTSAPPQSAPLKTPEGLSTESGRLHENINMPHGRGARRSLPTRADHPGDPPGRGQWRDFWALRMLIAQCQSLGGSHRPYWRRVPMGLSPKWAPMVTCSRDLLPFLEVPSQNSCRQQRACPVHAVMAIPVQPLAGRTHL